MPGCLAIGVPCNVVQIQLRDKERVRKTWRDEQPSTKSQEAFSDGSANRTPGKLMAGFQDFPPEIVQEIISYLSHRDVANLSIQCRFLHPLCDMDTGRKYRRLRITPDRQSLTRAFDRLLKILMRPGPGRHVRHIEFMNCPLYYIKYGDPPVHERDPTPTEKQLLRTAIHSAGFTGPDTDSLMGMLLPEPVEDTDWFRRDKSVYSPLLNAPYPNLM